MTSSFNVPVAFRRYKGPTPFPPNVTEAALDAVEIFEYRDGDVILSSFPKSGTHWVNEVIQLILHDGDPTKLHHRHRRLGLELTDVGDLSDVNKMKPSVVLVQDDPSPRVLKTHLLPSYLSKETWTRRIPIVYMMRNPRDVFVSFHNFLSKLKTFNGKPMLKENNFDKFLEDFIAGEVGFGSWCDHATEFEKAAAKGENILFVTYEDMKKDMATVVKSIANHLGHEINDEILAKIVENTTVDAMRRNYQEAAKAQDELNADLSIYVKTGVGDTKKKEIPEDKWKTLNEVFKEKVKDTVYAKRYFHD